MVGITRSKGGVKILNKRNGETWNWVGGLSIAMFAVMLTG